MRLLSNSNVAAVFMYLGRGSRSVGELATTGEDTPREARGPPLGIPDGEHDACPEPVEDAPSVRTPRELRLTRPAASRSASRELALGDEGVGERVPGVGRPAQLEGGDGRVREAARVAGTPERGLAQPHAGSGRGGRRRWPPPGRPGAACAGRPHGVDRSEISTPALPARRPQRRREVDPVALHHEAEDVPAQAAAEAVPRLACGGHDEAGRLSPWNGHRPL